MKPVIVIHSLNRAPMIPKLLDNIHSFNHNVPIYLIVEKFQRNEYEEVSTPDVKIMILKRKFGGIYNAMENSLQHIHSKGYTHVLYLDDDIKFIDDWYKMFEKMLKYPDVASLGCYFSILDLYTRSMEVKDGIVYGYGATQGWLLNVKAAVESGGFTRGMQVYGDSDIIMRIHLKGWNFGCIKEVRASHLNKRWVLGGNVSYPMGRDEMEQRNWEIMNILYQPYVRRQLQKDKMITVIQWRKVFANLTFEEVMKRKQIVDQKYPPKFYE